MKTAMRFWGVKTFLIFGAVTVFTITGCQKDIKQATELEEEATVSAASSVHGDAQPGQDYVPNEILVKFAKGSSANARTYALTRIQGQVSEKILTKVMERFGDNDGIYLIHTPLAVLEAISKVKGVEIEYAEPNFIYNHDAVSNDTYYTGGSLWGMYGDGTTPANQYGCQAGEAWAAGHTGNSSVVVGVIDEGAMFSHTDLSGNFWTNPYDAVDGTDNDGNGYVDDIHGWDFDKNDNTTFDGTQDDHGTHVSGTIGASGGNNTGVAGVNWNVTIISAKFLGRRGGTTANAIKAVD